VPRLHAVAARRSARRARQRQVERCRRAERERLEKGRASAIALPASARRRASAGRRPARPDTSVAANDVRRGDAVRAGARRKHQRAREQADAVDDARERAARLDVECDEQHGAVVGAALARRFEQPGGEARVERRERAARFAAAVAIVQ
jgi:hypothetical protein